MSNPEQEQTEQSRKKFRLRDTWKYLPGGSFMNYWGKGMQQGKILEESPLVVSSKTIGHLAYLGVTAVALTIWGLNAISTGEYNPLEQPQAIREYKQEMSQEIAQRKQRQQEKQKLSHELFYNPCYADVNQDGLVSKPEDIKARKRGGNITNKVVRHDDSLPAWTLKQLRTARNSYLNEKSSE